ncbi:MAG: TIGR01777 family oxidoreductase [Bacillota bacterium]|nr:TIGR01777 family oxidoreductase [Bacillota bacterium]
MKIAIAGGTGFVGKALVTELSKRNHEIIILTRNLNRTIEKNVQYVQWLMPNTNPIDPLENTDIFINLAGESINSGRWTEQRKYKIVNSRIHTVDEMLKLIKNLKHKPNLLINASAIGYYGTSEGQIFTEEDGAANNDFLSKTVFQWENKATEAEQLGVRTVLCRFGVILDKNQGALPKMAFPYKLFAGGTVGSGRQWLSWIHIDDVIEGILFIIDHEQIKGPVNFTVPNPVTMKEFGGVLGSVLHRPHWLPVPGFALKLLLGEMSMIVLEGQKVLPKKLIKTGFQFKYSHLELALKNIFPI